MNIEPSENPMVSDSLSQWDALIEAMGPASLLVIIRSRLGPALRGRVTEEDLLQESLLSAWRDRSKFEWRGLKSFRSWFLTIIDHRIRDAARYFDADIRKPSQATVPLFGQPATDGSEPDHAVAGSTTPSRLASHREQAERLRIALDALPNDLRDVVYLRLFEQLTFPDISSQLQIGEEAARSRFRKGSEIYRHRLRSLVSSRWTAKEKSGTLETNDSAST